MLFYVSLHLSLLFTEKRNFKLSIVSLLTIFFLIVFKGDIGCDYYGYSHRLSNFEENFDIYQLRGEISWYFLEWITVRYKLGYVFISIVSGFIACFFIFKTKQIVNHNRFFFLIFPIFILGLGLSGFRQFIAASIILYVFSKIIFKDYKNLLVIIVLLFFAGTFHISAMIFLIFVPALIKLNTSQTVALIILGGSFIFADITSSVFEVYSERYIENTRNSIGAIFRGFTSLFILISTYLLNKKYRNICSYLIIFILILAMYNSVALHRLNYYIFPIAVLLFLQSSKKRRNYNLYLMRTQILLFAYLISWFSFSDHVFCIIPYKSIISI